MSGRTLFQWKTTGTFLPLRSRGRCEGHAPTGLLVKDRLSGVELKKILIVDDDAIILKTTSLKLKANGYTVVNAADGAEAIAAVREEKPDLVILDINLPRDVSYGGGVAWDGFLLMHWFRQFKEIKDAPVILMSGDDPAEHKYRAFASGALAFFHKPIDHEKLLSLIRRTFDSQADKGRRRFEGSF
jgi:two-component system chemotaxis response regulator CheY